MVKVVACSCSRQRESRPSGRSRARLVRGRWTVRCVNRTAPASVTSRPHRARPHLAMPHATPLICRARRVAWLEAAWERSSSGALRSPCGASAQGSNWPRFWLRLESPHQLPSRLPCLVGCRLASWAASWLRAYLPRQSYPRARASRSHRERHSSSSAAAAFPQGAAARGAAL